MRTKAMFAALAALSMIPAALPVAASAQSAQDRRYDDQRRNDERTYRGQDGRYYPCKRSNGTTGAVVGGVGGAVAGNVLGGGLLGTVAGGVGGALLGKHVDKKRSEARNRRDGC